MIVKQP